MRVIYSMTRNLYHKVIPSLTSLWEHNPDAEVTILCEDDTLPIEGVEVINVSGQQWFPPDGANARTNFTYMALLRTCLPTILPRYSKVLSLDVDTIICDSLQPVWDTDLQGKWLACVRETQGWYKPFGAEYYNVGVCLYNLAQLREDKAQDTLVAWLNSVRTMCIEQDAYNLFGKGKIVELPTRYNENFATGYTHHPAVVHYAGIPNWWTNDMLPRRAALDKYISLEERRAHP